MSDTENSASPISWPISEDWLLEIIKEQHKTNSNSIKIVDFAAKQGTNDSASNLSDILAVVVTYTIEETGQPTETKKQLEFIIKLLPHDPFSRYFVTEAQFDLREIKFYTQILLDLMAFQDANLKSGCDKMKLCVPNPCYYTLYSSGKVPSSDSPAEPPESILVLQDMRYRGFKGVNFVTGLTLAQAECAIKSISVIHALSLGLKFKEKIDLNEKYPFLFQINSATKSYANLIQNGIPQLTKFLEEKGGFERELEILENLRPKAQDLIQRLLQPSEEIGHLTHTDFWSENLLFKNPMGETNSADNCCVLDWQMLTNSKGTNDIALLIVSSLNSAVRREHTSYLLDLYYSSLKDYCDRVGVDLEVDLHYTRNKIECDFRKSKLLAFLLCIGSIDIALGNPETESRLLDVLHDFYDDKIFEEHELIN